MSAHARLRCEGGFFAFNIDGGKWREREEKIWAGGRQDKQDKKKAGKWLNVTRTHDPERAAGGGDVHACRLVETGRASVTGSERKRP